MEVSHLNLCPETSLELLQEAIDVLDGAELAKNQRGEVRDAIVRIDRLTNLMQNHDASSYPMGSRGRIFYVRDMLTTSSPDHRGCTDASEALNTLLRQWCVFWAT